MKVRIGIDNEEIGTIAWRGGRFVVTGNREQMQGLIRRMQHGDDPETFLASLPRRLQSRMWAAEVPTSAEAANGSD